MNDKLMWLVSEWNRKAGVFRKRGEDAVAEDNFIQAAKWLSSSDIASHCARELRETIEGQE